MVGGDVDRRRLAAVVLHYGVGVVGKGVHGERVAVVTRFIHAVSVLRPVVADRDPGLGRGDVEQGLHRVGVGAVVEQGVDLVLAPEDGGDDLGRRVGKLHAVVLMAGVG